MSHFHTPDAPPTTAPDGRVSRILIVDEDASAANTLAAILRHLGYQVDVRAEAQEAVTHSAVAPIDLILTELHSFESLGLASIFQPHPATPAPSIIVLTNYATLESALRALNAGAFGYLVKPIDIDELRLTVRRAIERRRLEHDLAARMDDLATAHKQLQEVNAHLAGRIEQATAALEDKVLALDNANNQLEQAQEQHHRFIAMVAHEMRGPLNPIINYAQLAKRPTVTTEKRAEYMDIIVEHAHRLNRLVDDLQTATRLSTGQFSLQARPCDIVAAVASLVEQFTASHRDRQFSFVSSDPSIIAEVDEDRLLQAVRNLVDNAIKYSTEGGAIDLSITRDADSAHIRVADYGAGIPEQEMERIFEPFTRLAKKTADVSGSGLGLYITRGIAAAHHGDLHVENRVGDERAHGAIFTLILPLRAGQRDTSS